MKTQSISQFPTTRTSLGSGNDKGSNVVPRLCVVLGVRTVAEGKGVAEPAAAVDLLLARGQLLHVDDLPRTTSQYRS